jgi:hypothetical protein
MQQMRRIAIISAILGALIVADGIFQQITQYKGGETQNVLNLNNVTLTDGMTLIISGGAVLVVSLVAFLLSMRASSPANNSPQAKR